MDILSPLIEKYMGLWEPCVEEAPQENYPEYVQGCEKHTRTCLL
jgi:hypothetical protein